MPQYTRNCPKCNRIIVHTSQRDSIAKYLCKKAIKIGRLCQSCANSGHVKSLETRRKISECHKGKITFGGRKHSDLTKQRIAESRRGKKHSESTKIKLSEKIRMAMHKEDIRARHIKALVETKFLGKSTDRGQIELLEKWNKLGFNFQPNYQIHTDNFLCYLDGYDKDHNVVIEYDSKYHQKPSQKEKDLVRQNKIINLLKPKKFWRYNALNKNFSQII